MGKGTLFSILLIALEHAKFNKKNELLPSVEAVLNY